MKKYIAEMIGTMVLTLLGCGTAVFLGCDTAAGVVGTAIAFGLSVVAGLCDRKNFRLPYQPRHHAEFRPSR